MKKIYFLVLYAICFLACSHPVSAQRTFFISTVESSSPWGPVTVLGSMEITGKADDIHTVTLCRGVYTVTFQFKEGSRIIQNWNADSAGRRKEWEGIRAFSSKVDSLGILVNSYKSDKTSKKYKIAYSDYVDALTDLIDLDRKWRTRMSEMFEGSVIIAQGKEVVNEEIYFFSLASNRNVLNSRNFEIFSEVCEGQLVITFVITTSGLPEIFNKVFTPTRNRI